MVGDAILPAIAARLGALLASPRLRYRPFVVDGTPLGLVDDVRAERLRRLAPDTFAVSDRAIVLDPRLDDADARSAAMSAVADALRQEGALPGWRDERYTVAPSFGMHPTFELERGAARYFGVRTYAAHVNGLVRDAAGARMWLARRSPAKAVDPGMLDNLVGGGIRARTRVDETLVREAWEEAGIAADIAARAAPAGALQVRRELPDGLQRETIFVHDLELPSDFGPANQDGEAVEHRLVDLCEAARLIGVPGGPDEVTVDASLVVLDFLLRRGAIAPDAPGYLTLEALRYVGAER